MPPDPQESAAKGRGGEGWDGEGRAGEEREGEGREMEGTGIRGEVCVMAFGGDGRPCCVAHNVVQCLH
jgi:hypothetical protein